MYYRKISNLRNATNDCHLHSTGNIHNICLCVRPLAVCLSLETAGMHKNTSAETVSRFWAWMIFSSWGTSASLGICLHTGETYTQESWILWVVTFYFSYCRFVHGHIILQICCICLSCVAVALTLPMLRLILSKAQGGKDF